MSGDQGTIVLIWPSWLSQGRVAIQCNLGQDTYSFIPRLPAELHAGAFRALFAVGSTLRAATNEGLAIAQ